MFMAFLSLQHQRRSNHYFAAFYPRLTVPSWMDRLLVEGNHQSGFPLLDNLKQPAKPRADPPAISRSIPRAWPSFLPPLPSHLTLLPAMRPTARLSKLLVTSALASTILLLPVRIAHAQEDSRCQTERCWFEVIELLSSSDLLPILTVSVAAIYVANAAFGNHKKKEELEDLKKEMKTLENTMVSTLRKELRPLEKRIGQIIEKNQWAGEEKQPETVMAQQGRPKPSNG